MLQGIFKQKESRKFNYKGRYYNQIDNDIRRKKILDGEENIEVNFGDRFRRKIAESRKKRNLSDGRKKWGFSTRELVLVAVLALLLYFIMS